MSKPFITATVTGNGRTVSVTMHDDDGAGIHNQSFHLAVLC
jgi:hypothetical protein